MEDADPEATTSEACSVRDTLPGELAPGDVSAIEEEVLPGVYLGVVKSYNDRRGFGFVACVETAALYGRDVYMPKAEATLAAAEFSGMEIDAEGAAAAVAAAAMAEKAAAAAVAALAAERAATGGLSTDKEKGEKPVPAPRLAEEDLVAFRVRLSVEGYPQAAKVKKMRKFTGVVKTPPVASPTSGGNAPEEVNVSSVENGTGGDTHGVITSTEVAQAHGFSEIPVFPDACGQLRFAVGDEVTFCVPEVAGDADGAPLKLTQPVPSRPRPEGAKALMVALSKTARSSGSVLGCFALELPRTGAGEGAPLRPSLVLDSHAFGDKLVLAGLPADLGEAELMRFFSKQGACGAIVAHAKSRSFASVSFPTMLEVARFVGRTAHAFADEKETRIAKLLPLDTSADTARLPALPAPSLVAGEDRGSLLVVWAPLVLAVGYSVELRPAGADSPWACVEASSSRLGTAPAMGAAASGRFSSDCSSCRVVGLALSTAYEARVSYFTDCGTRSEASEASDVAITQPVPQQLSAGGAGGATGCGAKMPPPPPLAAPPLQHAVGAGCPSAPGSCGCGGVMMPAMAPMPLHVPGSGTTPGVVGAPLPEDYAIALAAAAGSWPPPAAAPPPMGQVGHPLIPPLHDPYAPAYTPPYNSSPSWRSPTGMIVPSPAQPALRAADEYGFAVSVQWPAVAQAAAYVVELREAGSAAFERFVRSAPEAKLGTLVELRVGGLRPGPPPGRVYVAQVRTVAADGSESLPSPPGWSPTLPSQPLNAGVFFADGVGVNAATTAPALAGGSVMSADSAPFQPSAAAFQAGAALYAAQQSAVTQTQVSPVPPPQSVVMPVGAPLGGLAGQPQEHPSQLTPPPPASAASLQPAIAGTPAAAGAPTRPAPSPSAAASGFGNWAPPPWLGQLPTVPGDAHAPLGGVVAPGPAPGQTPPPPPVAPADAKALLGAPVKVAAGVPWGAPGGPPPPPTGPPPPVHSGLRAEDLLPEISGNEECLILD
eukprot:TRINITY_DN27377_c0_g1_i3.p1 TRINITY_DN27377_c0_g1~~TRINITY_DN27377_c0_g1_i3.p1  ORF type:complete len:995 (+),score=204.10 TRINITY_DN27377_c0_g1_i3:303-3287(+)